MDSYCGVRMLWFTVSNSRGRWEGTNQGEGVSNFGSDGPTVLPTTERGEVTHCFLFRYKDIVPSSVRTECFSLVFPPGKVYLRWPSLYELLAYYVLADLRLQQHDWSKQI